MTDDDKNVLNEVIFRLTRENSSWRNKFDETEVVLRRRAPEASGLTLKASVEKILEERDLARNRIQYFRDELKNILQVLINKDDNDPKTVNELRKRINLFLFNNSK